MLILVIVGLILNLRAADAIFTTFGNTGPIFPPSAGQGTMPGSILTPVIRLDIDAVPVLSDGTAIRDSGDPDIPPEIKTYCFPHDEITELLSVRVHVKTSGTVRDILALAIAYENYDGKGKDPLFLADAGVAVPTVQGASGTYTPKKDPIMAAVSVVELIKQGEIDPDSKEFYITFNMVDDRNVGGNPPTAPGCQDAVPPIIINSNRNPYTQLFLQGNVTPIEFLSDPNGIPLTCPPGVDPSTATRESSNLIRSRLPRPGRIASAALKSFYFLVASSGSLENTQTISMEIDATPGQLPTAFSLKPPSPDSPFGNGENILEEVDFDGTDIQDPDQVWNLDQHRFAFYDYAGSQGPGGIVIRVPEVAMRPVAPGTIGPDDTIFRFEANADYSAASCPPMPPTLGILHCRDASTDQVPNRKLESGSELHVVRDLPYSNDITSASGNRIWSQFPPGYPIVSLESRDTSNPNDTNPDDFSPSIGRIHFDSRIASGAYPSPEVYSAGGQTYAWFAMDVAGGWPTERWTFSDLQVEVQGLGDLGEIPRDGIDNDLDGLTDENGVEDTPQDRQLPGRNDDLDFFVDLKPRAFPPGLSQPEIDLGNKINSHCQSGRYNVGWDPVFKVRDIVDTHDPANKFDLPVKYYRDLVIPGLFGEKSTDNLTGKPLIHPGLTEAYQPELKVDFSSTFWKENPAREAYIRELYKLGFLQDRLKDDDKDGFTDEETENGIDDDGDGLTDEDNDFVPVFPLIDEEIDNFFVDAPGGRAAAYDVKTATSNGDFVFIDLNHNGVYDDGRNDQTTPNVDEFQERFPGDVSPLVEGDPYSPPIVFPIDDDLDAPGEDGNPNTPPPVPALVALGPNGGPPWYFPGCNEDCRDLAFQDFGQNDTLPPLGFPPLPGTYLGLIRQAALYKDVNGNSRLDPGSLSNANSGGDFVGPTGTFSTVTPTMVAGDPDRYVVSLASPLLIPMTIQGHPFFLGIRIPDNMPIGTDFQASILAGSLGITPKDVQLVPTADLLLTCRFPAVETFTSHTWDAAVSHAYQVTKRQFAHLEVADAMGYRSPTEVDGGFIGRPYLDSESKPSPVLAINIAGATGSVSEHFSTLNAIRINFDPLVIDGGLFNPNRDLKPLSNRIDFTDPDNQQQISDSGVSLYLDNKTSGRQGEFDPCDTPVLVNLESLSWNPDPTDPVARSGGYYVILKPQEGIPVPDTDFAEIPNNPDLSQFDPNRGYDLFVCVRTSAAAGARNAFRAFIRPGDLTIVNGRNTLGTSCISHPYVCNVPVTLTTDVGKVDTDPLPVIPSSDSIPVIGMNMRDENLTFGGTPARWATLNLIFENEPNSGFIDDGPPNFTPSDLLPVSSDILRNIPLDPAEDNDNDSRTFAIPDGIDNDNDGLTDEGVGNSLNFDLSRYTSLSGVALFRDMPGSDHNGRFDDPLDPKVLHPDLPVFLSGEEEFIFPAGTKAYITLALDHDPVSANTPGKGDPVDPDPFERIPADEKGTNFGPDYFVVIRTSKSISTGDDFRVRLGTHGVRIRDLPDNGAPYVVDNICSVDGGVRFASVVGTTFGYMPGATTGLGPLFPNRQPYLFPPLINARLVPSANPIAEEPLSPGDLYLPELVPLIQSGASTVVNSAVDSGLLMQDGRFQLSRPFDLYEGYQHFASALLENEEDGNDLPSLVFLQPRVSAEITTDLDLDPGTVFLRWNDIDEDSPSATVTLVYFPVVIDPVFGELFPQTPNDSRFEFHIVSGVPLALNPDSDIDQFNPGPYTNHLISEDNENVNPVTGRGDNIFTWDARLVAPGLYRIGAFLNDQDNPRVVAVGGKILIMNERPILHLTQP
jgi:hypothetical protein